MDEPDSSPDGLLADSAPIAGEPANSSHEADPLTEVLVPAAAAAALRIQRRRVTAKALGDVLRADGYAVSNAEASALLDELKPESPGVQARVSAVNR